MSDDWNEKASRCPKYAVGFEPYHKWFNLSTIKNTQADQVATIMCGVCFHTVNISEAFKYRDCFKEP